MIPNASVVFYRLRRCRLVLTIDEIAGCWTTKQSSRMATLAWIKVAEDSLFPEDLQCEVGHQLMEMVRVCLMF